MRIRVRENEYRTEYVAVNRDEGPLVEVKSVGKLRLRYRITCIIVVHLENGTDYPVVYGRRVHKATGKAARVSRAWDVPVSGNYREVVSL